MSRAQSPEKLDEDSLWDEERTRSSGLTAMEPQSPISADGPTEKVAETEFDSELTIQSSLQVLGAFIILFNSYSDTGL